MKGESFKFEGKRYKRGKGWLKIGDNVIIHPTDTSSIKKPYEATVIVDLVGGVEEICTSIKDGQHTSIMRDYLFDRLERK